MCVSLAAEVRDDAVDVVGEPEHQILEAEVEVTKAGWDMTWSWATAVGLKPPPREQVEATGWLPVVMG